MIAYSIVYKDVDDFVPFAFEEMGVGLMSTVTVRVRPHTYRVLQDLASKSGESLPDALDRIIEESRRSRMFEEASVAYAAIAADPAAHASWRAEIATWDVTVGDGLPVEPESSDAQ